MKCFFGTLIAFLLCLFGATISISIALDHGNFSYAGCDRKEREALLKFKHGLGDPSNRLESWNGNNADCCRWFGVVCDNSTGHVIELHLRSQSWVEYYQSHSVASDDIEAYTYWERSLLLGGKISESLQNLTHLKYLDLSNNNFGGIQIPRLLGSMESLRFLNLCSAGFGGFVPHNLGNLSNLQYLNLNGIRYYSNQIDRLYWLSDLRSLEFLDLSFMDLSKAIDWLDVLNTLPSLVELHLSGCSLDPIPLFSLSSVNFSSLAVLDLTENNFDGEIPPLLQNITSLTELHLSRNQFNSSIPNWLQVFSRLKVLHIGENSLQGKIPSFVGNLTSLNSLDLSSNFLIEGGIPPQFKNLCELRSLSLSQIQLNQEIKDVFEILSGCVYDRLESLDLSGSRVSGHLTDNLGRYKNLTNLVLNSNFISGPVPETIGELNPLRNLDLSSNKLNGSLPISFGKLQKLERVDISQNSLEGEVTEFHFRNLNNLREFYAYENQLTLRVKSDWIPPFQRLQSISLGSWHLGPQFPTWLPALKHLRRMDLSNSNISSTLPNWFVNFSSSLTEINLSGNQMHGKIPYSSLVSVTSLIDLSSNQFEGPLPNISTKLEVLDLSNNSFSGTLFSLLCDRMHLGMSVLNLGENLLSGEIPDCWMNWKNLFAVKLSNNHFIGKIPQSIGRMSILEYLNLNSNNVSGEIPLSLQNCDNLSVLDLGENELEGDISAWTGDRLEILNLRHNKFHGHLSEKLCNMTFLQILDLSGNDLTGTIPKCVCNLSGMSMEFDGIQSIGVSYSSGVEFTTSSSIMRKGAMAEYSNALHLVRSLDLSNNKLSGEIPQEISRLDRLQVLNVSHNLLVGRIPNDVGAMKQLESLDFSNNQLYGEIPRSMSSMTFLNYLDVSNNKLSGEIPSSTQLQSLDSSSFIGNDLCGPPLTKSCRKHGVEKESPIIEDEETEGVDWFYLYVSIAPGFVVGFWAVLGPLAFNRRWRHLYFDFLTNLSNKIRVWFHLVCC